MCRKFHGFALFLTIALLLAWAAFPAPFAAASESQGGSGAATADDVAAKPYVSAMSKEVSLDGSSWSDEVDVSDGDVVRYRLRGTLPQRLAEFSAYPYAFEDVMDDGLSVDVSSLRVSHETVSGSEDVTGAFRTAFADGRLTVSCDDVISAVPGISPVDVLVVTYEARVSDPDVGLSDPNENRAHVRYVDKEGKTEVTPDDVTFAYSFALRVSKRPASGGAGLSGAKFAVQGPDGGWYDGSGFSGSESSRKLLVTDDDGFVLLSGLSAGRYRVHEVEAPVGYEPLGEVVDLTVTRGRDASGKPTLSATAEHATVSSVDAAGGTVVLVVEDEASRASVPSGVSGVTYPSGGTYPGGGTSSSGPLSHTGDGTGYGIAMVLCSVGIGAVLCGVTYGRAKVR